MLKTIWKFFIIGVLCNSLLLLNVQAAAMSDGASVSSRIDAMNAQLKLLTPGTPEYVATQTDIVKLQAQQVNLSVQTAAADAASAKAKQTCELSPASPECLTATDAAQRADAQKEDTLIKIAADAEATQQRTAANAAALAGTAAPGLSSADQLAIAHAADAINVAIQAQKDDAATKKVEADAATAARQAAQDHADALDAYAKSQESKNKDPVAHAADVKAAADAAALVPPLKVKEDEAVGRYNDAEARVIKLENEKTKTEKEARDNKDQNSKDLQSGLRISLGDKNVDNSKLWSDGTSSKLSAEDQALYDSALQADITMVILGTVTNRLNLCKAVPADTVVPDIQTAQAAGLMFVTGEVAEYTDLIKIRAQLQNQLKEINGNPNDRQIQALEQLKLSYEKIYAAALKKKALREGAATAYAGAATAAAAEAKALVDVTNGCGTELNSKCSAGVNNAIMMTILGIVICVITCASFGACNAWYCAIAAVGFTDAFTCQSGGDTSAGDNRSRQMTCEDKNGGGTHIHAEAKGDDPGSKTVSSSITAACLTKQNVGSSQNNDCGGIFGIASAGKGGYQSCDAADRLYEKNMISCPLHALDGTQDENFYKIEQKFTSIVPQKNYIEIISDFIFSAVHAGMLSSMGVSKDLVVKFVKNQSPIFANALDTQLAHPLWRTIAWKALGNLVNDSIASTDAMLNQIQSDIDKITAIIKGARKQMGLGNDGHKSDYGASNNYKALDTNIEKLPCITGSNVGSCKAVSTVLKASPGYLDLPTSVKALTAKTAGAADGLNNSSMISSGTLSKISDLSNSANAIKIELAKREKALQRAMGRNGYKIDIAKEADKFADKLKSITKSGLSASGMSAQEMRSMMGGGDGTGTGSGAKPQAPASSSKKTSSGAGVFIPAATVSSPASSDKKDDGTEAAKLAAEAQANKAGASVDAAKMGDTVNEDNGYTLFEVITNRYQKSAYPRLFKKVKE